MLQTGKDVIVSFSRIDIGEVHFAVAVCDSLFKSESEIKEDKFKINEHFITKSCKDFQ
jgi:hypothetical protein